MNDAPDRVAPAAVAAMLWACVLGAAGCRLGGASSSAGGLDEDFDVDVNVDIDAAAPSGEAGRSGAGGTGAGAPEPGPLADAGTPPVPAAGSRSIPDTPGPMRPRADAATGDPAEDSGSASDPDADGCGTPIDGCNPITNTGCVAELGMHCDVDLFAPTLSGVCVFSAPAPTPDACLAIPPTQTCPPKQTCVDGACLSVCLCDADCGPGSCCTDALGDQGFKTCTKC